MSDDYMADPKAKSIGGLIEALNIFAKHSDEGEDLKFFCQAEHDEIFFPEAPPPDSDDGKRLDQLGFYWDEGNGCWSYFT